MINKKTVYIIFTLILLMLSSVSAFNPSFRDYTLGSSSAGSEDIKCGDINGDGLNEVVSIHFTAQELRTTKNLGGFLPNFIVDTPFSGIAFGSIDLNDWDGDGDLDIVATDTNVGNVYVYTNDGLGSFTNILTFGTGDLTLEDSIMSDLDDDGDLDVVYVANDGLNFLVRQGVNGVVTVNNINSSGGSRGVDVGDIDNDGDLDIVGCGGTAINLNTQTAKVDGSPASLTFEGRLLNNSLPAQVEDCVFSDLDNDGFLDIVYSANNRIGYMENNFPFGFNNPVTLGIVSGATTLAIEDYNNDGLSDIVFPSTSQEMYLNLGDLSFTAYNIASDNNLVAVGCDVNNDGYVDVVGDDGTTFKYYINTESFCVAPAIFCDDFQENTALTSRDWDVINNDNTINNSFFSNASVLLWNTTDPYRLGYYSIEPFTVDYDVSSNEKVNSSIYAPLFSIEFVLTVDNSTNNTRLQFDTFDERDRLGTSLQFRVSESIILVNWFNGTYENIGSFTPNTPHKIKIEEYLGDKDDYSFNSTFNFNEVKVYVDNVEITDEYTVHRIDNLYLSTYEAFFSKDTNSPIIILDDYYHYVGTDRLTDTSTQFYQDFYGFEDSELQSGDFADTIEDFWSLLNLNTQTSKTMFGLIMLVVTVLVIVGVFLGTSHGNTSGLGLVLAIYTIIYTVFAVFIGLFPVWILLLFGVMGAGMVALGIALNINNGGV